MRIRLRLRHLLGLDDGTVTLEWLASEIGVKRGKLSHLLDNDAKQISREVLEKCCEYLIRHGILRRQDLPHALFLVDSTAFWPLVAMRQRIAVMMGVRWLEQKGINQQVMAADAMLQSVIVNQLTGVRAECPGDDAGDRYPPQVIDLRLAACWGAKGTTPENIRDESRRFYHDYKLEQADKAIICVGSIKSNPMCEMLIASGFQKAAEFTSEDSVADPVDRSVPFYMLYRDNDPHPASCWAGRQLAKESGRRNGWPKSPGIYYEKEPKEWACLPCDDLNDAAIVYYYYQHSQRELEVVLGGYTGRSTRGLAEMFRGRESTEIWPPQIDNDSCQLGVFLVRFKYREPLPGEGIEVRPHQREKEHEVIPLSPDVLEGRLAGNGKRKHG